MFTVHGPGEPFITLFDEQPRVGPTLPEPFQRVYGSWPLPAPHHDRPFSYVNFVMSHVG